MVLAIGGAEGGWNIIPKSLRMAKRLKSGFEFRVFILIDGAECMLLAQTMTINLVEI